MTDTEAKWLAFAKKYNALTEAQKLEWDKKLTFDQQIYLKKVISKDLNSQNSQNVVTSQNTQTQPIEDKNINNSSNLTSFQNQNPAKVLSLSMIMPSRMLNVGMPAKATPSAINTIQVVGHNLSKDEYLKNKKINDNKNSMMQAILVILVLALPIGSIIFALNNASSVEKVTNGSKSITQVLAENSAVDFARLDDDFNDWIAKYNDLSTEEQAKNADPDQDGLTNAEEQALATIPINARTCNSPRLDGEAILAGIDPVSCKPVNFTDPSVAAKFDGVVSRTTINHRLSLVGLGRYLKDNPPLSEADRLSKLDIDYTKNPTLELLTSSSDLSEISKIEISWSQISGVGDIVGKMEENVVAYPDLGVAGQAGVTYLSGRHIDKNNPNSSQDLFSKLDLLTPEDGFKFSLTTKDGQTRNFYYKVKKQNLVLASDAKQFTVSKSNSSELILATPWPNSSPEHRMVVKAILDRVE